MRYAIIGVLFFLNNNVVSACECVNPTYSFIEDISDFSFVGIVELESIDSTMDHYWDRWFYNVKILNVFTGGYEERRISIPSGGGLDCIAGLPSIEIGEKFFVKGNLSKRIEYEFNETDGLFANSNLVNKNTEILVLSICNENSMRIVGNRVIGSFTKSLWEINSRKGKFVRVISFGILGKKSNRNNVDLVNCSQEFKLEYVIKRIRIKMTGF